MAAVDSTQVYRILQNLSNLELSFMEYSTHSKNFIEYGTYLAYMDNLAIRKHNLWKFYFNMPITKGSSQSVPQIPNVLFDNTSIPRDTPFSICKLFNFPNGPLHQCDYYTVLYNLEGLARVTIGSDVHKLGPGDIFIVPPMVPYALDIEIESICLSFDLKKTYVHSEYVNLFQDNQQLISFLSGYITTNDNSGFIAIHTDNNAKLQDLSLQIFAEYINKEKYYQNAMKSLLSYFFTLILRCEVTTIQTTVSTTKAQQKYKEIINYIRTNYQTTDLDDTAEHVHFSKQYICRIVKEATGDTFSNVLLAERLKVACNLLSSSDASLEEISELCGFSTASYFSRIFKQVYNLTPSAYRKNLKNEIL